MKYMKVAKFLPIIALAFGLSACNKPAGELVGAPASGPIGDADPYGMTYIRKGAFLMGANDQSPIFSQADNNVMVSVNAFWMDETEITNSEYRQFVNWVRDSIAYGLLIDGDPDSEYALRTKSLDGSNDDRIVINWNKKIPWEKRYNPEEAIFETLAPMFYDEGFGSLRTNMLRYNYSWRNIDVAVDRKGRFDVSKGRFPEGAKVRVDSFWVENDEIHSTTVTPTLTESI